MRRALPLLPLLAACEPRRDPRNIERALAAKTIDVEALEDLLKVEADASEALLLEAFVVERTGEAVFAGLLDVLSHELRGGGDIARNRAVYALPILLPRGEYRILVRTDDAESHFTSLPHRCSESPGAASRWVPFRVESPPTRKGDLGN
jgi:hypothetical protein